MWPENVQTVSKTVEIIVPAIINVDPNMINLKNLDKGNGDITAYIEFPGNLKVSDIVLGTIRLNNTVIPVTDTKYGYVKNPVFDYDNDGKLEFMVKFPKESLIGVLIDGLNVVSITGQASNYRFVWTGNVQAQSPGNGKK